MMCPSNKLKLKLNVDMHGLKAGKVLELDVDSDGVLLDRFWRRRLQDSAMDNCVSVVIETEEPAKKPAKTKE